MGVFAIHRKPTDPPINNTGDYCRAGCWTPPGRPHGLACPVVDHHDGLRTILDDFRPVFYLAAFLVACLLLWALVLAPFFFVIRSL